MKRDYRLFLLDINEAVKLIEKSLEGLQKEGFLKNKDKQDATIRRLEIIGEATKNLPDSFKRKHPNVEWGEIAKFRDKITHGYFGIDLDIVWVVVKKDLPQLKEKIKKILEETEKVEKQQKQK